MAEPGYPLWSDEPSNRDLLSFGAVAATVVEAVLDDKLDPIALGIFGSWGQRRDKRRRTCQGPPDQQASEGDLKALVIPTQPWRYDPAVGPKESLIAEVLAGLRAELEPRAASTAKTLLKKLVRRVDWAKGFKIAAKAGLALQLPSVDDVLGLVKETPDDEDSPDRGLAGCREDFEELMGSDDLRHVSRVVVLVDDLDRCLPETVVETLEAIRLSLSVKGMSFVIAPTRTGSRMPSDSDWARRTRSSAALRLPRSSISIRSSRRLSRFRRSVCSTRTRTCFCSSSSGMCLAPRSSNWPLRATNQDRERISR